jgi:hypothetical protein
MPCERDCPDRYPGCYCEKKQAWDAEKEERKAKINAEKKKDYDVAQVRNPPRAERLRKKI